MTLAVYLSSCRGRIDNVLDLEVLAESLRDECPLARVVEDLFDPDTVELMERDIARHGLDAVVLAGNSVDHYRRSLSGRFLKDRLVASGINANRIITANLLEQVALPHGRDPVGAHAKALALLRVAVSRADEGQALLTEECRPLRSVLVLGATTEGLVASQRLLEMGFEIVIADRSSARGRAASSKNAPATAAFVVSNPNTTVLDDVSVTDASGWIGDFEVRMDTASGERTVRCGGILLAEPHEVAWVAELRGRYRIDVDDEGRARSLEPSTHPAETVEPGLMVVPLRAEKPSLREKVSAADASALALVLALSPATVLHPRDVSNVDETLCGGCASCVKTCAFEACHIGEDGYSSVDVRRCRGCGKCVVGCPVGARDVVNSPHGYLIGAIDTLASAVPTDEKVLGFLCGGCGYPAADAAGEVVAAGGESYPASFLPLRIPCGGRLDTLYVLQAFKAGFDGVCVFRCREGHCHNVIGNLDMDRRVNLLRTVLRSRGIDDDRLRIVDIAPDDPGHFVEAVNELFDTVRSASAKGGAA